MAPQRTIKNTLLDILTIVGFTEAEKKEAIKDISDIATLNLVNLILNELPEAERNILKKKFNDSTDPEQQKAFLDFLGKKNQDEINVLMLDSVAKITSGYIDNILRIATEEQKSKILALIEEKI